METIIKVAEVIGRLAGPLGSLIGGLIAAGKSPEEAEEIVRRDIESRRKEYLAEKAADEAALERKHGRAATPANPYPTAVADRVMGCERCGKPAALVGDRIPADGLCPWCRVADAPGVAAAFASEQPGGAS